MLGLYKAFKSQILRGRLFLLIFVNPLDGLKRGRLGWKCKANNRRVMSWGRFKNDRNRGGWDGVTRLEGVHLGGGSRWEEKGEVGMEVQG